MEEKEWEKIIYRRKLPKRYIWGTQWAKRTSRRRRAMIMGIRKEIAEKGIGIEIKKEEIVVGRVNKEEENGR